jgi:hypothetical protein
VHLGSNDYLGTQELCTLLGLNIREYEDYLQRIDRGEISALEVLIGVIRRKEAVERIDHSCQTDAGEPTYEERM